MCMQKRRFPIAYPTLLRRQTIRHDYKLILVQRQTIRRDYKLFFVQRRAIRHDYKFILCSGELFATTIIHFSAAESPSPRL